MTLRCVLFRTTVSLSRLNIEIIHVHTVLNSPRKYTDLILKPSGRRKILLCFSFCYTRLLDSDKTRTWTGADRRRR
ncbi:hypothetical protein PUN28_013146 [Cardiocondyla obscurior]|uniref:Secreted protein n=1 Tax=Cardiocondyla obscurior TaxID=286306 RepID=A0AAW2F8H5_9HYME